MKKILLILLTLLYSFTVFTAPVKAADDSSTWYNQNGFNWFVKVYDTDNPTEIFGERYTAAQVQWIFYSLFSLPFTLTGTTEFLSCAISGDIGTCIQAFTVQAETQTPLADAPPIPSITQQIFADRPLSGITYFKNTLRKFNLIPEAQAQTPGFGFGALDPILPLWRGSRNIAYVLLILVTVVMAFMIMFRVKISPQIVISVQSALPKVVTAIILITFSYAIAGFLIDLMYVVIGLVSLLFTNYVGDAFGLASETIFNYLTTGQPVGGVNIGVIGLSASYLFLFMVALAVIIATSLGAIGTLLLSPVLAILYLIIALVGFILLIIHVIRIIFMLLKAFTNILLLTIFAPFLILAGTIVPSIGFGSWLKDFVANLSVFVVTGTLFLLSIFFLRESIVLTVVGFFGGDLTKIQGFLTLISNVLLGTAHPVSAVVRQLQNPVNRVWPPLLGSGTEGAAGFVFLGVSFVLFTLIPRTAEVIQGFISGRPFAFGTAIGEATTGPLGRAFGGTMGAVSTASQIGSAWTTRFGTQDRNRPPQSGTASNNTTTAASTGGNKPTTPGATGTAGTP